MTHKPPHGKPPVTRSDPPTVLPSPEDAAEGAALSESASPPVEEPDPDPYDEMWDPDMDIRPERIRKTRGSKVDTRPRGGGSPRGKRREGP